MPSDARPTGDTRVSAALQALSRQIAAFRSFAASQIERAERALAADDGTDRARLELGDFAAGRIDVERFATLSARAALDITARRRLARALGVLRQVAEGGDEQFLIDIPAGSRLVDGLAGALASLGRVFGAAAAIELARGGRYRAEHDTLCEALPFAMWTRSERRLAPPIVVTLDGEALHAGALAELVDGAVKIVLLPRGACGAAPLVRLVTPGAYIAQSGNPTMLERFGASEAPGVLALVPASAAEFVHDPSGGAQCWQRLTVMRRPDAEPRRPLGGRSAGQLVEELRQLDALAERPSLDGSPLAAFMGGGEGRDPADRLAAWLLEHTDLADVR